MVFIHNRIHPDIRNGKILTFITWMDLKEVTLSEINQREKEKIRWSHSDESIKMKSKQQEQKNKCKNKYMAFICRIVISRE